MRKADWIFAASIVWFATILGVLVYILFCVKMN